MKGKILKILKAEQGVISGEAISAELGISRVSVWKHLQKLQEFGYNIDASPMGYRLISSPDALFPWEFPDREKKIHFFPEITSTMDIARDFARKGYPHFTVVIAGCQNRGRGRLKRTWLSSQGGLYFTTILRPQISPVLSLRVNFAASLILAQTLNNMFDINARVKWPNDILIDGMKISGILSEIEAEADIVSFINVGIGINVNNDPTDSEPKAVSLKQLSGSGVSRKRLLSDFLNNFENCINSKALDNIIQEWKKYTVTLNRYVKIVTHHEVLEGIAVDLDENGALILELSNGSMKKVLYGDCFHL
ncbi:MAG: biotin--[acetyl-CoA-carboxylase] ligase [Deltaproteobacteria bacterium]|nr:biotin--[acetyl-CoA-carboxylase] ligase [Deltaproteobacteria bacterium]MBW2660674.1 biotin--[acetyl-CoA-carboxylase] ligase [Deltaproteobacteria bacterium]